MKSSLVVRNSRNNSFKELSILSKIYEEPPRTKNRSANTFRDSNDNFVLNENYEKFPIKPGFRFLEYLIKAPKASISSLKLNIPETLYVTDQIYLLFTSSSGYVQLSKNPSPFKYYHMLEKRKGKEKIKANDTLAILKFPLDEGSTKKIYLNWGHFANKIIGKPVEPRTLMQRYVHTNNTIVRLFYYSYIQSNKSNFALLIKDNKETTKMSGHAILPYEKLAGRFVYFINKGYSIRINQITLDFLKDKNGTIWFYDCKHLKIDNGTLTRSKSIALAVNKEYHCHLCKLKHNPKDLGKIVTFRMLSSVIEHYSRRDKSILKILNNFEYKEKPSTQTVKVCIYCYELINTEIELIELEGHLSRYIHTGSPKPLKQTSEYLPKSLKQWRVLVYLHKLFDYCGKEEFYIHLLFESKVNTFKVNKNKLKILRVYYVFTEPSVNVYKSICETGIEVRMTKTKKHTSHLIASGFIDISKVFPKEGKLWFPLTEACNVIMFSDLVNIGTIKVVLGISPDKIKKRPDFEGQVNRFKHIYLGKDSCIVPEPLPNQWIETLSTKSPKSSDPPTGRVISKSLLKKNFNFSSARLKSFKCSSFNKGKSRSTKTLFKKKYFYIKKLIDLPLI